MSVEPSFCSLSCFRYGAGIDRPADDHVLALTAQYTVAAHVMAWVQSCFLVTGLIVLPPIRPTIVPVVVFSHRDLPAHSENGAGPHRQSSYATAVPGLTMDIAIFVGVALKCPTRGTAWHTSGHGWRVPRAQRLSWIGKSTGQALNEISPMFEDCFNLLLREGAYYTFRTKTLR